MFFVLRAGADSCLSGGICSYSSISYQTLTSVTDEADDLPGFHSLVWDYYLEIGNSID
jgi:hypothetical protein